MTLRYSPQTILSLPSNVCSRNSTHSPYSRYLTELGQLQQIGEIICPLVNTNALGPGAYPFACPPRAWPRAGRQARLQRRRFRHFAHEARP